MPFSKSEDCRWTVFVVVLCSFIHAAALYRASSVLVIESTQ